MCTASWLFGERGYELWFNRDERPTRATGEAPRIHSFNGTTCLFPTDPDAGGSWLGCNEHGLALGILNHYSATSSTPTPARRSRGLLLTDQLHHRTQADCLRTLEQAPLSDFAPFLLLMLAPQTSPALLSWDGNEKTFLTPACPLTTSSLESQRTLAHRQKRFETFYRNTADKPSAHLAFHHDHDPATPALGALMRREDARTVSTTHLQVSTTACTMHYSHVSDASPPCIDPPCTVTLARH